MNRSDYAGAILLLSGTLLFGLIHLAVANYVPNIIWSKNNITKFGAALQQTMVIFPYVLSIIFMSFGLILLFLKELKIFFNKFYNE